MKKVKKKKTLFGNKKRPASRQEAEKKSEVFQDVDEVKEEIQSFETAEGAVTEPVTEDIILEDMIPADDAPLEEISFEEPDFSNTEEEIFSEEPETVTEEEESADPGWDSYLNSIKDEEAEGHKTEEWDEYLNKRNVPEKKPAAYSWEDYEKNHHADTESTGTLEEEKAEEPETDEADKTGKNRAGKKRIALILAAALAVSSLSGGFGYSRMKAKSEEFERLKFEAVAKKGKAVNVGSELRKRTSKEVKKQKDIPAYSLAQIRSMDMSKKSGVTAADLKLVTQQGLVGLEQAFVNAENRYNVNALFLVAIASLESANGTICFRPNNMFGYGQKGYPSKEACIYDVASGLGNNYLKTGASLYSGKTISDVNKRYASSSTWDDKVSNNMYRYYQIISRRRRNALNSL